MKIHVFTVRVDFEADGDVYGSEEVPVEMDDKTFKEIGKEKAWVRVHRIARTKALNSVYADDRIDYTRQSYITNHEEPE